MGVIITVDNLVSNEASVRILKLYDIWIYDVWEWTLMIIIIIVMMKTTKIEMSEKRKTLQKMTNLSRKAA